jgi:hypothetical protein
MIAAIILQVRLSTLQTLEWDRVKWVGYPKERKKPTIFGILHK